MNPSSNPINIEFLPDWAKESPSSPSQYSKFSEENHDPKPSHRPYTKGKHTERRNSHSHSSRKPHKNDRRNPGHTHSRPKAPPPSPVKISFLPEPKSFEAVATQLRTSPKAYPVFSLGRMFLEKPERHEVFFQIQSENSQENLYQCETCKIVSLREQEMVSHLLKEHLPLFYKAETKQGEPIKGNFTSVAQCKLNGTILGPSNHHEYQTRLMHLYKTAFSKMPFQRFKESIVSIRDPEVVKKWQEQTANKCIYFEIQNPEAKPMESEMDVERHFRQNAFSAAHQKARTFTLSGELSRKLESSELLSQLRSAWESENRFPGQISRILREMFFKAGLHVFKGKKGMQFVCLARPKPLTVNPTDLSPNILKIIDFIEKNPECTRAALIEAIPLDAAAQANFLQDLQWLISQGHVIEYHNGILELTKPQSSKPKPASSEKEQSPPAPQEKPGVEQEKAP